MSTHDADPLPNANPADRRTMTRDPKATGGPIVETGGKDKDGNMTTIAGSRYLTTNIDGKWYVCNTRGEPFDLQQPFTTESEAVADAQRRNDQPPQDADKPD